MIAIPASMVGAGRPVAGKSVAARWILPVARDGPQSPLDIEGGPTEIIVVDYHPPIRVERGEDGVGWRNTAPDREDLGSWGGGIRGPLGERAPEGFLFVEEGYPTKSLLSQWLGPQVSPPRPLCLTSCRAAGIPKVGKATRTSNSRLDQLACPLGGRQQSRGRWT